MDTNLEIIELGADGGSTKIIRLKGPLLISNMFSFQNMVRSCQAPNLVLDMTEVPYSDSAGIGILVGAYVSREKVGRKLLLVGVNSRVRSVLQVTQVEGYFQFADKIPESAAGA
jgi:anti-sigma B factor antagonist